MRWEMGCYNDNDGLGGKNTKEEAGNLWEKFWIFCVEEGSGWKDHSWDAAQVHDWVQSMEGFE